MRSSLGAPHSTEHCKDSVFFAFLQVFCAVFFVHRSFCSICGKRVSILGEAFAFVYNSYRAAAEYTYHARTMGCLAMLTIESRTADS
jgi:hypothetical protein